MATQIQKLKQNVDLPNAQAGLFWKEWHEGRMTVIWSAALMAAFYIGAVIASGAQTAPGQKVQIDMDTTERLLVLAGCIGANISGASVMSLELRRGTLSFLDSLPIQRSTIWWTKITAAIAVLLSSIVAILLTFFIFSTVAFYNHNIDHPALFYLQHMTIYWYALALTLPTLFVATVCSMLIGHPISSIIVGAAYILVSASAVIGMIGMFADYTPNMPVSFWASTLYVTYLASATYVSYQLFIHGETLQGSKRYRLLARTWLFDVGIVNLALFAAYWFTFR